jgi:hypothetical protein
VVRRGDVARTPLRASAVCARATVAGATPSAAAVARTLATAAPAGSSPAAIARSRRSVSSSARPTLIVCLI